MIERRFRKGQQKIAALVMALIMVITSVGIIPIKADAAGRKLVKKLSVAKTSLKLEEGENEYIKYKVTATKGTSKKIVLKVSNKKVISAKVSKGKIAVKAKKEGKSTITVMTKEKNKKGKRIAKKIQVVVENEDDDDLEYDFEDDETYEEDESTEDADVSMDQNVTAEKTDVTEETVATEKVTENPVVTEAPVTTEKVTEKPAVTEAPATTEKPTEAPKTTETIPSISYQAHVQDIGWMPVVKDGATAGTTGKAKRLESLKITLNDAKGNSMIKYRAHVEETGWQGWKTSGQAAGTEHKAKRMEAIQIQLTGAYAEKYDIYYRVHVANFGWLGWAKNGETAGSEGLALQMEAIQIKLVKKNAAFSVGDRHVIVRPDLTYQAHCAYCGWKSAVSNGRTAGTIGEKRQLEGLKVNLADTDGKSGVEYRAHVGDIGWQGWKNSGELAGTTGQNRRMEAIEIKLKGNLAKDFDIYYRVHVAYIGWLGWAKNGETAGTTGGARQAEAIEIIIVGKEAVIDRGGAAYQKLTAQSNAKTLSINWNLINSVGKQPSGSDACGCYALAYCRTILDGRIRKWSEFDSNGGTNVYNACASWGKANYASNFASNPSTVYQQAVANINEGKPMVVRVYGTRSSRGHYVAIVGYTNVTSIDNLSVNNFLIIDSGGGTYGNVENLGGVGYSLQKTSSGYQYCTSR